MISWNDECNAIVRPKVIQGGAASRAACFDRGGYRRRFSRRNRTFSIFFSSEDPSRKCTTGHVRSTGYFTVSFVTVLPSNPQKRFIQPFNFLIPDPGFLLGL
jgi:hypothetical protein